ncbi:hypothetical protein PVAND_000543 [Polypedilum vanderplanki]|uniref:Uncharacterized protein n=1 Tax=Polypedilum vanderplanki TaxID=319348 RepID=A0A9J6BKI0_POLVA|nr:hypothetical protein PVAND_000543 [Polypedilum vanderplanki]
MAAWMRKKYPHLVQGAFSSSGPVQAQIDFFEYKEVMSRSIERVGGDECAEIIGNAFTDMEILVEMNNTDRITNAFMLCSDLEIPIDIPHFFYEVSDIVAGLVQSHRAGRIERACEYILNEKYENAKDDIEAFGAWIVHNNAVHEESCLDFSYANNIIKYRDVEWGSEANQQMRQWIYQTCAEFAWFQTSNSPNQIFGTTYGVDYFLRICNDLYDNSFSEELITHNVRRTNYQYGAFRPEVTNVVFTNGDLDPWHPMSVLTDLNEHSPSIITPLAAHVADMGATSENDSNEMRATKLRIKELVRKWVGILNYDEY